MVSQFWYLNLFVFHAVRAFVCVCTRWKIRLLLKVTVTNLLVNCNLLFVAFFQSHIHKTTPPEQKFCINLLLSREKAFARVCICVNYFIHFPDIFFYVLYAKSSYSIRSFLGSYMSVIKPNSIVLFKAKRAAHTRTRKSVFLIKRLSISMPAMVWCCLFSSFSVSIHWCVFRAQYWRGAHMMEIKLVVSILCV